MCKVDPNTNWVLLIGMLCFYHRSSVELNSFLTLNYSASIWKNYNHVVLHCTENVFFFVFFNFFFFFFFLIIWRLFQHIITFELVFSRKRKLSLIEMLIIKSEESSWLDLVVYKPFSGELTDCYLPLTQNIRENIGNTPWLRNRWKRNLDGKGKQNIELYLNLEKPWFEKYWS